MTPWTAHLYTALGAGAALGAALAVFEGRFRDAFIWLSLAVFIDATDGALARALRVKERLPQFDGAKLDDIVDYLTYVFVPMVLVVRAGLLPEGAGFWVATGVLLASGYGFARTDAKVASTEYFFTGFPSYWNVVALYLYAAGLPPAVNAAILMVLAALVFVPLRYVYPSRTRTWRGLTIGLGAVWSVQVLAIIWRLPDTSGPWLWLSLVFPVYYVALSLWLHARHPRSPDQITRS